VTRPILDIPGSDRGAVVTAVLVVVSSTARFFKERI
jgi:hypothetical protein